MRLGRADTGLYGTDVHVRSLLDAGGCPRNVTHWTGDSSGLKRVRCGGPQGLFVSGATNGTVCPPSPPFPFIPSCSVHPVLFRSARIRLALLLWNNSPGGVFLRPSLRLCFGPCCMSAHRMVTPRPVTVADRTTASRAVTARHSASRPCMTDRHFWQRPEAMSDTRASSPTCACRGMLPYLQLDNYMCTENNTLGHSICPFLGAYLVYFDGLCILFLFVQCFISCKVLLQGRVLYLDFSSCITT